MSHLYIFQGTLLRKSFKIWSTYFTLDFVIQFQNDRSKLYVRKTILRLFIMTLHSYILHSISPYVMHWTSQDLIPPVNDDVFGIYLWKNLMY